MKNSIPVFLLIFMMFLFSLFTIPANCVFAQKNKGAFKIGTYDSRVIVFAYSRSQLFADHQKKFGLQSDSVTKAKDSTKLKELSVKAMSYQHLLHQMVFSSGSVLDIIGLVKDKLPEVAKQAGVVMIVSKFEVNFSDPSIEIVDLTNAIIPLFNPKENIEKMAGEIGKTKPVPIEELTIEQEMLDMYCNRFGKK
jgi:hypothetical protein